MRKTNKTNEVIKYLERYGKIDSMKAFERFGATRLSAIIFNLRRKGYVIVNNNKTIKDRYGNVCNYVEYRLEGKPDERL